MSGDPERGASRIAKTTGHHPLSLSRLDLGGGEIGRRPHYDDYFGGEDVDRSLAMVFERLLERLPEDQRDVLHLCVVGGQTMNGAAVDLGWVLPSGPDRKRVSRERSKALRALREMLEDAPWLAPLLGDYARLVEG